MDHNRNDLLAGGLVTAKEVLFGARFATHTRIDGLEMGWVRHEGQLNLWSIVILASKSGSQVVLDVAAHVEFGVFEGRGRDPLKFGHNNLHGLPDHVRKGVKTTSVRHANHKFARTQLSRPINGILEPRNEGLAPFEAKSLHRVELGGHEFAPPMRPINPHVLMKLCFFRVLIVLNLFELFADPVALFLIFNVHEFDANIAAVGVVVCREQIPQLPHLLLLQDRRASEDRIHVELLVQVRVREAIVGRIDQTFEFLFGKAELFGERWRICVVLCKFERVDACEQVTVCHVGTQ